MPKRNNGAMPRPARYGAPCAPLDLSSARPAGGGYGACSDEEGSALPSEHEHEQQELLAHDHDSDACEPCHSPLCSVCVLLGVAALLLVCYIAAMVANGVAEPAEGNK